MEQQLYGPARRRAVRKRRRKKRLGQWMLAAGICVLLAWGTVMMPGALKGLVRSGIGVVSSMMPVNLGGAWDADTLSALKQLATERPEAQAMLDAPENWPAEVAALAARNPEALDFVLAYPSICGEPPVDCITEAQKGVFPALYQWDTRWGCAGYGGSIVALSGCGPTVLSIAVCGLTGSSEWTPASIAAWSQTHGYVGDYGTNWDLMRTGCAQFGLTAEELPLSESAVFSALEAGHPIICAMRPGDFTTTGHFIILTGTEDGMLRLVDPNSPAHTSLLWEYSRVSSQIKNLWAYSAS